MVRWCVERGWARSMAVPLQGTVACSRRVGPKKRQLVGVPGCWFRLDVLLNGIHVEGQELGTTKSGYRRVNPLSWEALSCWPGCSGIRFRASFLLRSDRRLSKQRMQGGVEARPAPLRAGDRPEWANCTWQHSPVPYREIAHLGKVIGGRWPPTAG